MMFVSFRSTNQGTNDEHRTNLVSVKMMEACVCLYMNKSFAYVNDEMDHCYFESCIPDSVFYLSPL